MSEDHRSDHNNDLYDFLSFAWFVFYLCPEQSRRHAKVKSLHADNYLQVSEVLKANNTRHAREKHVDRSDRRALPLELFVHDAIPQTLE